MDLKRLQETIETGVVSEGRESEVTVEGDVIVPDSMPDIQKILQIDGRARMTSSDRQGDKLLLTGSADFCVLYIPDADEEEAPVRSIHVSLPFKDVCAVSGGEDGKVLCTAELTHIGSMLLNSRKLSLKAHAKIETREYVGAETAITVGVESDMPIETKTRKVWVRASRACGAFPMTAVDTLEVPAEQPAVREILKMDGAILGQEMKMITNKAIVKGMVRLSTLYLADTVPPTVQFMEHDIPFTEILDMPGAAEGMEAALSYTITNIYYETDEGEDGIRKIGAEITMEAHLEATENIEITLLEDCFCPPYETTIKRVPLSVDMAEHRISEQLAARKMISFPTDVPLPARIYHIAGKPTVQKVEIRNHMAEVTGKVEIYVLYLTEEKETPLFSYQDTIPFSFTTKTECADEDYTKVHITLLGCGYTLSPTGGVDVRANLEIGLCHYRKETLENIAEITVTEAENSERPAFVVAFTGEGDTLWSIAKKYKKPCARIREANHLEENAKLSPGTKLFIP